MGQVTLMKEVQPLLEQMKQVQDRHPEQVAHRGGGRTMLYALV